MIYSGENIVSILDFKKTVLHFGCSLAVVDILKV